MDGLNYHHLQYFWTIAREGGVTRAARRLGLAQPTLSAQMKVLEAQLGVRLFVKMGRTLALTDLGRVVYRYAEGIFGLGQELQEVVAGKASARPEVCRVGILRSLPRILVRRLLQPAFQGVDGLHLVCREEGMEGLLDALARRELDLAITDAPLLVRHRLKARSHLLGESPLGWFGTSDLVRRHPGPLPRCLEGAPVLLPAPGSRGRLDLEDWFARHQLRPRVVGEVEDSGLLKSLGQEGIGLFVAPLVVARDIQRQHRVARLGPAEGLKLKVHALAWDERNAHPGVVALVRGARRDLFKAQG